MSQGDFMKDKDQADGDDAVAPSRNGRPRSGGAILVATAVVVIGAIFLYLFALSG